MPRMAKSSNLCWSLFYDNDSTFPNAEEDRVAVMSYSNLFNNLISPTHLVWASQVALVVKNSPADAGDIRDVGMIPGLGRSPGEGHGNLPQYSFMENPKDRGASWATVHRVAKSQTQLKQLSTICFSPDHSLLLHTSFPTTSWFWWKNPCPHRTLFPNQGMDTWHKFIQSESFPRFFS